jgi:hypothetical protein
MEDEQFSLVNYKRRIQSLAFYQTTILAFKAGEAIGTPMFGSSPSSLGGPKVPTRMVSRQLRMVP